MKNYEMSTDQPLNPGCAVLGCSLYKRLTAIMLSQVCECTATKALHVPSMLCVPQASADSDKSSPPKPYSYFTVFATMLALAVHSMSAVLSVLAAHYCTTLATKLEAHQAEIKSAST